MFVLADFFKNFNSYSLLQGNCNLESTLFNVFKDTLKLNIIDCSKKSLKVLPSNKEIIKQGKSTYIVDNNIKDGIYYQPFGTQSFPDFMEIRTVMGKSFFICLESKSSSKDISVWNCSLPVPAKNCIYIHRSNTKNLYVFTGDQIITKERISELKEIDNEYKQDCNKYKDSKDIFQYYPRPMYNQTKSYDAIFNQLGISNTSNIDKILEYLRSINKVSDRSSSSDV